ncbi:methyltransferase domain-containing protein [Flavobacteriaceae bacterium 3-367]|uniref:class I SAM-dependent methyltransferase n=1 Tax=Eudoraea algarum TaxID=3417568 RepID=UPI0032902124
MEQLRKPFQGVTNILRFNWHFYVLFFGFLCLLLLFVRYFNEPFRSFFLFTLVVVIAITLVSVLVSYYVYDLSGLYAFDWLGKSMLDGKGRIVNIHAGFDETSVLLRTILDPSELVVLDFYDPKKHTEVAIKRARRAYPAFPDTIRADTTHLPLPDHVADEVFTILAAHEIRNEEERIIFFKELSRILKANGTIIVTEHLRDIANFLAYNIGFFHFYSKKTWLDTFDSAGLLVRKEIKITPFITTFILEKNGITP